MIWRRRCLVLVPVLSFLAAVLFMSCGGGSSSTTTVPVFTSLIGLNVCLGAPPTGTPLPTPTPTAGPTKTPRPTPTPKPTPTPMCSPVFVAPSSIGTGAGDNTVQFNAQGIFGFSSTTKKPTFHDITGDTSTTSWNLIAQTAQFPGGIMYQGNGLIIGVANGCTYFNVIAGNSFQQSVVVGVNTDPSACPTPPPVPTPAARATSSERMQAP